MRSTYCKQNLPCWCVQLFQASATTLPMVIVLLKKKNRCFRFVSKKSRIWNSLYNLLSVFY